MTKNSSEAAPAAPAGNNHHHDQRSDQRTPPPARTSTELSLQFLRTQELIASRQEQQINANPQDPTSMPLGELEELVESYFQPSSTTAGEWNRRGHPAQTLLQIIDDVLVLVSDSQDLFDDIVESTVAVGPSTTNSP